MKTKLFMYLVLCIVLVFTLGLMAGCKGSDGSVGPAGPQGQQGLQGPNGTFANSNCTDCHHLAADGSTAGLPQPASLVVSNATASAGGVTTLTAKSSILLASGATVTLEGYYWQYLDGLPATLGSTVTGQTVTVTLNTAAGSSDYRDMVVANEQLPDRTMVVPINSKTIELGENAEILLTAFGSDGNVYYATATVTDDQSDVADYAPRETTGLGNVPVGRPVLLNARGTGAYAWILSPAPGSSVLLDATNIKNPYFTPDVAGKYTLSLTSDATGTTTPDTMDIYAGVWRGEVTGVDMNTLTADNNGTLVPDSTCTACHAAGSGDVMDKFTPWKSSGHATKFEEGINGGGHYGVAGGCFPCHTVGFDTGSAANGFGTQSDYATFESDTNMIGSSNPADSTRYSTMATSYPDLFQESGIQCENCHGPQNKVAGNSTANFSAAHTTTSGDNGSYTQPRVSLSSDVCAACHAEPTHHGRFQEWQETGHSNFGLAEDHGTSAGCAACHSAQGNLIYQKQLEAGSPLKDIPAISVTWTKQTVQPQTCVVCHDPHNEGTTTGLMTDAEPRITGDTPKLPAGYAAIGVGKGAMCIICHNGREGASGSDTYLHEDGDPVFGVLSAYAAPHHGPQGDVLTGHNAYFMPNSGGAEGTNNYSPHATITDSCVTCHLVKTLPPALDSNYGGTNHSFLASLDICAGCHGIDSGFAAKLQADTQAALDQLKTSIEDVIVSQATGSYSGNIKTATYDPGWPHTTDVTLTYADTTPSNTISINTVVPISSHAGQILAKALWNYNLINNDQSRGIHNPEFIRNVVGNTNIQLEYLLR